MDNIERKLNIIIDTLQILESKIEELSQKLDETRPNVLVPRYKPQPIA